MPVTLPPATTSGHLTGRNVIVAGATSASGHAVAAALAAAGAHVIAVGTDATRLSQLTTAIEGTSGEVCNLADAEDVTRLAARVHHQYGAVDGLIHLVGGWRGGGGLGGQTDADWDFLHERIVQTLRNTTRTFVDDLLASSAGRLAIVSTDTLEQPKPGNANYAAAKAAAEAWTRAIAHGFSRRDPMTAAATIFVVHSLDGLEEKLANGVVGLWTHSAMQLNDARISLSAD